MSGRLLVVEGRAEVRHSWELGELSMTRDELCERLLSAVEPGVTVAAPLAVRLVLSDVLADLAAVEPWLRTRLEQGGPAWIDLVAAFEVSLTEARRSSWIGPLAEGRGVAQEDPRARVLLAAGRRLDEALRRAGLVEPAAVAELVASALGRAPPANIADALDATRIVATGIASWLPSDLALWRSLDARLSLLGGEAKIELAIFDRPFDAARALDPLGRLVDSVAEALEDAPHTRTITPVLGDFTFGPLPDAYRATAEVRRADNAAAEARAILDAVEDALASGASAEQIAIVVPDGAASIGPVARALEESGIAVQNAVPSPRAQGGFIACALEAMIVAEQGAPRLGLAALLRAPYLDATKITGILRESEARAALRRLSHILEDTPSAVGETSVNAVTSTVRSFARAKPEELAQMVKLADGVASRLVSSTKGSNRREHAANTRQLFRALGLSASPGPGAKAHLSQDLPAQGVTRAEVEALARDQRGLVTLFATLDAYERAASRASLRGSTTFTAFRLELQRELAEVVEAGEASAVGAVRISTLRDLPTRSRTLLVFAGALEGSLDPDPEGIGVLDTATLDRLLDPVEPGLRASLVASRQADRIRLAIAADAAARVVITYATHDDDGGLQDPHPFVAWLERQGVPQTVWRDRVRVDRALTLREERLRRLATRRDEAPTFSPLAALRADVEARRESAFGLPAPSGEFMAEASAMSTGARAILREETGGGVRPMSVTSLDRFGACLFQGFAAEVLRAREPRAVSDVLDARQEGTLIHGALAAAFDATRSLWACRPRDAARIRRTAEEAARAFLDRQLPAPPLRRAGLDPIEAQVAKVVDWSLLDEEWDFSQAEARFGMEATSASQGQPPVLLEDGAETLRLSGSIDRVDVAHGRDQLRVIDYKRSMDSARRLTRELGITSFQLAVYARAASLASNLPAAPGAYLPTRHLSLAYRARGAESAWAKAHEIEGGWPRYARRALDIVGRVRRGDVEARPSHSATCEVCDFDGVCRKPRFVISASAEEPFGEAHDGD